MTLSARGAEVEMRRTLEPLGAGMDLNGLDDINNSPLAGEHDRLRALDPATLEALFAKTGHASRPVW